MRHATTHEYIGPGGCRRGSDYRAERRIRRIRQPCLGCDPRSAPGAFMIYIVGIGDSLRVVVRPSVGDGRQARRAGPPDLVCDTSTTNANAPPRASTRIA